MIGDFLEPGLDGERLLGMVRDDRDDVHVDLADAACIEQMAKAVVELGDERDHLAALRSRPKRPVHLETRRDVDERRLETLRVVVKKPCHHPHEEGVGFRIVELLGLQNTSARRKKRRAYGGNYSRTIRARQFEILFYRHTIFLSLLCIRSEETQSELTSLMHI